ncbi:MAG TPA: hypothetical protein VF936_20330 [Burkholderiales bacterium]
MTRYTIHASDPVTLAAFRFGIGFIPILAIALLLGALFFSLFFVIYNVAMSYTSAARCSAARRSAGAARLEPRRAPDGRAARCAPAGRNCRRRPGDLDRFALARCAVFRRQAPLSAVL